MDSGDRKEKQDYLKREILHKGYDMAEFAEFMLNEKEDGLNVDNWEHRELIMIVDEFISKHSIKNPPVEPPQPVYDDYQDASYDQQEPTYDQQQPGYDYQQPAYDYQQPADDYQQDPEYAYQYEEDKGDHREYGATEYQNDYPSNMDDLPENYDQQDYGQQQEGEAKQVEFIPDSQKRQDMMNRYEEEREIVRDNKNENDIKEQQEALNKRKDQERENRKKKNEEKKLAKKLKKAEKAEQELLEKTKLETELEKALAGELPKKFAEMVTKNKIEFKPIKEKCKGIETGKNALYSESNWKVSIGNPELIDEGFLWGKSLVFTIQTSPLGYKVKRKDKDFNTLREYLVKKYPHVLIPACPEFIQVKTLDKSFLRKRQSLLTRYLNKLLLQKELKGSPMVFEFFTTQDYSKYSTKLNSDTKNLLKIKRIHDFATVKGECSINVTKRADYFGNALEKYYTSHDLLFKKFYNLGKKLSSDLMEVAKTLTDLSNWSNSISTMYEISNSKQISEIYQDVRDHFKRWSKDTQSQARINLQYLPQFFNYTSLESQSYKDMHDKRVYLLNKYTTKANDLNYKKDKLFKAGRPEKWELSAENLKRASELVHLKEAAFEVMLPNESAVVKSIENWYHFLNTRCYNEIKRMNKKDAGDLKEHLQFYANKMSEQLTESNLTWADFESALQDNEKSDGDEVENSKETQ